MKVLLTKDVSGLGRAGQIMEVSDGHARNFLLPKHLALPATSSLLAKVQKEEAEKQAKVKKETERFLTIKNKLEGKTITIKAKAEGKNLFAGIHEKELAKTLTEKLGVEISPAAIKLVGQVKSLGLHPVELRLAENIVAHVKLNVEKA